MISRTFILVQIPDPIYTQLTLQNVDDFVIKVRSCWATPTSDAEDVTSYTFIEAYQVVSTETNDVAITENCVDHTAAFSFNSFTFGNQAGAVYFHCRIDLCDAKNEDCSCSANARRRRSASAPDTTLTIGPISVGN